MAEGKSEGTKISDGAVGSARSIVRDGNLSGKRTKRNMR